MHGINSVFSLYILIKCRNQSDDQKDVLGPLKRLCCLTWRPANEFSYKGSFEVPILSFKPRALILSSFNQCTRNRAAVPRATWSRSTDHGHGRRSLCFASHKNKTLGLVLKFQLYRVVYQDNLEKKKKTSKPKWRCVCIIILFVS